MLPDLLIGSIIILVPLGILIIIIAIDLDSKEQQLSRRIKKLNMTASSLAKKKTKDLSDILDGIELDNQDKEQIDKLTTGQGIKNDENHEDLNASAENYAIAVKEVTSMRLKEKLLLGAKIRRFKIYAAIMYILIWFSLGILPLLHKMGFMWGWK